MSTMRFGPVPPKILPVQDPAKVLLLAERWQRAAFAHQRWAEVNKVCVDMLEGRHWTADQLAKLANKGRPSFKFNIIAPIVRLVLGYQANNKTDIKFKPGQDTLSSEEVAEALSKIAKVISRGCGLEFVDGEVFLDGLACGRAWFDTRLDWETNDLGEAKTGALDPFSVYVDPDCDTYDVNESASFMQVAKMVSLDEIEGSLGKDIAQLVRPWTMGQTPLAPISSIVVNDEIAPIRFFGQREDSQADYWDSFYSMMGDFVDPHRKTIRVIETQHKVREPRNVIIDLETGDSKVLPLEWGRQEIAKAILYGETMGNPLTVQRRIVERIHWTTMVGDVIVYDAPSFYGSYTMTGYFPYFRRGVTRGMVEDLVDPQLEKNKRRNARIETEAKTANGGWLTHSKSMNPVEKANLKKFGSTPGVNVEWSGEQWQKPEQIQASQPGSGHQRLEADADEDIRRISGINESALGDSDIKAQSGRAIEARQRQAVISVQLYMTNFKRSKELVGRNQLYIVQNYYTEPRIYRLTGDDGKATQEQINQIIMDPASGGKRIINDVTVGKYIADIDDAPLSATFLAAQFDEMMMLVEKLAGAGVPIGPFADLIISSSSMPRKDEWIQRIQALSGGGGQPVPGAPPPGGGQPLPAPQAQQALPAPGGNVVPMPVRA